MPFLYLIIIYKIIIFAVEEQNRTVKRFHVAFSQSIALPMATFLLDEIGLLIIK